MIGQNWKARSITKNRSFNIFKQISRLPGTISKKWCFFGQIYYSNPVKCEMTVMNENICCVVDVVILRTKNSIFSGAIKTRNKSNQIKTYKLRNFRSYFQELINLFSKQIFFYFLYLKNLFKKIFFQKEKSRIFVVCKWTFLE